MLPGPQNKVHVYPYTREILTTILEKEIFYVSHTHTHTKKCVICFFFRWQSSNTYRRNLKIPLLVWSNELLVQKCTTKSPLWWMQAFSTCCLWIRSFLWNVFFDYTVMCGIIFQGLKYWARINVTNFAFRKSQWFSLNSPYIGDRSYLLLYSAMFVFCL